MPARTTRLDVGRLVGVVRSGSTVGARARGGRRGRVGCRARPRRPGCRSSIGVAPIRVGAAASRHLGDLALAVHGRFVEGGLAHRPAVPSAGGGVHVEAEARGPASTRGPPTGRRRRRGRAPGAPSADSGEEVARRVVAPRGAPPSRRRRPARRRPGASTRVEVRGLDPGGDEHLDHVGAASEPRQVERGPADVAAAGCRTIGPSNGASTSTPCHGPAATPGRGP